MNRSVGWYVRVGDHDRSQTCSFKKSFFDAVFYFHAHMRLHVATLQMADSKQKRDIPPLENYPAARIPLKAKDDVSLAASFTVPQASRSKIAPNNS